MNHDYSKILEELNHVKYELKDLEGKIDDIERDIRSEIEHKVKEVEWKHSDYDRRISLTEKVLFGAVGIILISVLGAVLTKVII
jgi:flagellar biosynthesis chaperone FliJ